MTESPIIGVSNASYVIGERSLWQEVNLVVQAGEMVAITGESGSGKTTLLNCIGLIDSFSSGNLFINGHDLSAPSENVARRFRRDQLGYLFQDFALIESDSVMDNIRLALAPGNSRKQGKDQIRHALDSTGLGGRGKKFEKRKVYQLSGGEQQRVALARIIVRSPRVILADEPTASLDRGNAEATLNLLRARADAGAAVVLVSHDPWVVGQLDREYNLSNEGL